MHNTDKTLKTLIIDDDRACREIASRFFTSIGGHMVEIAKNGREGLKRASQFLPDIIILDMNMPDINGLEVMKALCADAATRNIPVIMLTGASLSDAEQDRLKLNCNFLLLEQKPAKFEELLKRIDAAISPGIQSLERRIMFSGESPEAA